MKHFQFEAALSFVYLKKVRETYESKKRKQLKKNIVPSDYFDLTIFLTRVLQNH